MIDPSNSEFLAPTMKFRRLSILMAIHNSPEISQKRIGQITHLSSSMVNNYMKKLKQDGAMTIAGNTNRTQSYHLTPAGDNELMSLLIDYSAEIIRLYGDAKREVAKRLSKVHLKGIRTVALFGVAETAEVVYAAIKKGPLVVKAIFDSDKRKQGQPFNGLIIQPPELLKGIDVDAVVITSFGKQKEIHAFIRQLVGERIDVVRLSDL